MSSNDDDDGSRKRTKASLKKMKNSLQSFADAAPDYFDSRFDIEMAASGVPEYVAKKVHDILSGVIPVPVSYDDGDQSPLYGSKDQFVKTLCVGWRTRLQP